jgi:hypothetical protein
MGLRLRYPLASRPEDVTLEGRELAMAGNRGVVKKRGFTLALLNENSVLKSMLIVSHMGIYF